MAKIAILGAGIMATALTTPPTTASQMRRYSLRAMESVTFTPTNYEICSCRRLPDKRQTCF